MSVTEWFGLLWLVTMVAVDIWLHRTGRETISHMMTRLGRGIWWVRFVYVGAVVVLYLHFWVLV